MQGADAEGGGGGVRMSLRRLMFGGSVVEVEVNMALAVLCVFVRGGQRKLCADQSSG